MYVVLCGPSVHHVAQHIRMRTVCVPDPNFLWMIKISIYLFLPFAKIEPNNIPKVNLSSSDPYTFQ